MTPPSPTTKRGRTARPKLRVALVGAGSISRHHHLPTWRLIEGAELVAVADPSPAAHEAVAAEFPDQVCVTDYRPLLDDPTINVFDICVPSALHAEISIAALEAGKHVLCQKPMATCRADAAAMLDAWRASGRQLMIGQHMRFELSIDQLRDALERHPLGHVYYARAQWLRRRRVPGRATFTDKTLSGGGAMYDLGVHLLDLAWWMMGCPRPTVVSGRMFEHLMKRPGLGTEWGTWDPKTIDVEDFGAGLIRFENGAALALEASWLGFQSEEDTHRLHLYGTQAGADWPAGWIGGEDDGTPWNVQLEPVTGLKAHKRVVHAFAEALLNDLPVPVSPLQTANVIAMLDALYASSASGHEVAVDWFE